MTGHSFSFADTRLTALPSGALHWPDRNLLIVSDLHFGKSERLARRGSTLLPPYETRATLTRLDADLKTTHATSVICLGDSFDDLAAARAMNPDDHLWLIRLMAGRDWTWISGNHDPGPLDIAGTHRAEARIGPLAFRHVATQETPEISGHYHPKARLGSQSRRCFLADAARIILPAYGTYTGGLWCHDAALTRLMRPDALAILTGPRAIPLPMPRS